MMQLPLVVGVDGSEPSLRAADWAADEAMLRAVPLRVCYASLWERYEGGSLSADLGKPSEAVLAQDVVDHAARRALARQPHLKVARVTLPEEPEYALVREGREACALVVGSRGRGGIAEFLLGSVSLSVAAQADCPVIVLRGGDDNQAVPGTRGRILLGVGEEATESPAVRFAVDEARRRGVPLEAVRAWRRPAHESIDHPFITGEPARLHEERAVEALEWALKDVPADADVRRRTVEGPARKVLADLSREADLLVVGAERREGYFGMQLGRVAHAVLHHSACPVAVVPQKVRVP